MKLNTILLHDVAIYAIMLLHVNYGVHSKCNSQFGRVKTAKGFTGNTHPKIQKRLAEQKFLEFMGMTSRPDIELKRTVKVPRAMWELYHKWNNDTHNDNLKNDVDTVSVIDEGDHLVDDELQRIANLATLRFNVSRIRRSEHLRKAELHLFSEKSSSSRHKKPTKHVKVFTSMAGKGSPRLARVHKLPMNMIGYVNVDITHALSTWMNNSELNDTFLVEARDSDDEISRHLHLRKPRSVTNSAWFHKKPRLFLYTSTIKKTTKNENIRQSTENNRRWSTENNRLNRQRVRRSNSNVHVEPIRHFQYPHHETRHHQYRAAQRETCRLRPYRIDFKKLEWDAWIIAPTGYMLNYCTGECPRPLGRHYNATNHAIIQNFALRLDKNLVPPLCCIPTNYRAQTFLHMDITGEIKLKTPSRMVATACGCR